MKTKISDFINHHSYAFGAFILGILTLLVYGDVVFGSSNIIISHSGSDISLGFYNAYFSFSNLAHGTFPLWNPHMLSGYPWYASFQTLMLYPPAWIFLFFSVGKAVNIFIAFHVFLIGFAAFCWLKRQDLHPLSCVLGGALLMLCSQVTMQIYAGEVTPIACMPWMIFLLLVVDGCFDTKHRLRWILAGTGCVALQIMAGFPQHVYYTGLVIGIYFIGKLFLESQIAWRERVKVLLSLVTIYIWGILLCAIQLLTTISAATETARQGKLPFGFAGSYSFPPWNLLTLLAPKFFGDDNHFYYWGRSNVWEMLLYIGITGLVLTLCGVLCAKQKHRFLYLGIVILTALTAFGFYTPFYTFLYNYVPGFGSFRANFRILFECSVFLTALAALGFDALLKSSTGDHVQIRSRIISAITAMIVMVAAIITYLQSLPGHLSWFQSVMLATLHSKIQRMEPKFYTDIPNVLNVANYTALQLTIAAITLIVITLLLYNAKMNHRSIYLLGILAVVEVLVFTISMRPTFPLSETQRPTYKAFLEKHPGEARFVQFQLNNWANGLPLSLSGGDLSGYESFRLRRYDSFVQFAMGMDPAIVKPSLHFKKASPLFRLLRCKYIFDDGKIITLPYDALPHVLLVPQWKTINSEKEVLLHLKSPGFNPRQTVLLESVPHFPPSSELTAKKAQVTLINQSPDWLDIKATTDKKSILLVTDAYAKGWKVFPYPDSAQQNYDVMPADYILRGIPLSPGTHHFRLEYAPDAFYRGKNISLAALALYLLAWCGLFGIEWRKKYTNGKNNK